jgi:hypothetical protein
MIQAAIGWEECHLHSFHIGGSRYGMQVDDFPEDELDETSVKVVTAVGTSKRFAYEYDFGDCWEHEVTVEASWGMPMPLKFGVCLDGENACPPEDCGGPGGYVDFLRVLADPTHEEYEHMCRWIGGPFEPSEFDVAWANARLQAVR